MSTAALTPPLPAGVAPPPERTPAYIAGPAYDRLFFIYSPLWALLLGAIVSPLAHKKVTVLGSMVRPVNTFIGAFIAAHLVIVFFRSHTNATVFRRFPLRFTVVPVALFTAMYFSLWVSAIVFVIGVWWDVYHSGMQTFGLGRIYDMKAGNKALAGRRLDIALNLLIYLGPILAGVTLQPHLVEGFRIFESIGTTFFTQVPMQADSYHRYLFWGVLGVGLPFIGYYLWYYRRLTAQGYHVSQQKVALYASTALCSIFAWGFNTFGQAFFIMNFFHALQYFAIIWWSEEKTIARAFHVEGLRFGRPLTFALLLGVGFGYGIFVTLAYKAPASPVFCLVMVVSIMHFWYDGFIWSVRKQHV